MFNSQITVLSENEIQLYLLLLFESAYFPERGGGRSDGTHLGTELKPHSEAPPDWDRWASWPLLHACQGLVNTGPAGSKVAKWLPGQTLLEVLAGAS